MKQQLVLILLLLIIGCKNNQGKADLQLSQSQFTEVLKSLHLYEGKMNVTSFQRDSIYTTYHSDYDSIFESKGVSKEQFINDYNIYLYYFPSDLDTIYQTILSNLEVRRDSLEQVRRDSLNNENKKQLEQRNEVRGNKEIKNLNIRRRNGESQ